ncbi:CHAD domain-containing protein [Streptomyces alfalfae]|uniref:Metal-binding protein n=2 Tax=Streptomyces alfalfae TaxID=1642299 RepID=A0ABM6GV19_9ACTN|nr:metal-binding protein [Streptomyces alfalfae]AYA17960.1 CHAD domain-containing protein [Streptomyces fradiae]RXX40076.1 CHAD domain-containing protein [Streptomyces alfalfae]RZM96676.1 CHAD domain-containing protein [Streptomyces alfalfae]
MAQQHHEMTVATTGAADEALPVYLRGQATEFLRSLRLHRESTTDARGAEESLEAARALRRAARRISAALHTFRPLLDPEWAAALRPELAWLRATLSQEHACAARLSRLLDALHRLSGTPSVPGPALAPLTAAGGGFAPGGRSTATMGGRAVGGSGWPPGAAEAGRGSSGLTVGAAKAAALLERQLTLARTRAHSTALQDLGSSRFHAVADTIAVLASEVPLIDAPDDPKHLAAGAEAELAEAVAALPLGQAGHPYNAGALTHGLASDAAPDAQDAPWLKVRSLLRLHRYAQEVLLGHTCPDPRVLEAGHALDVHREAATAAQAAAHAARTPRIAPATAYALGVLHADQRHEVEAARFAFQQVWQHGTAGAR